MALTTMNDKTPIIDFLLSFCFIVYIGYIVLCGLDTDIQWISISILLLSNVYSLVKCRNNKFLVIIWSIILYCNYSIIYENWFDPIQGIFNTEISEKVTNSSINLLAIFNALLYLFSPQKVYASKVRNLYIFTSSINPGYLTYIIIIICLLVIFFLGFDTPTVPGERGSPKPVFEYAVCIFILGYHFFKKKDQRIILDILIILFALKNFIYGGRILGIQFLTCYYIFRWGTLSLKKIPIVAIPLVLLMYIIGVVRGELLSGNFDTNQIVEALFSHGLALDTAYSAYYTSKVYMYMYDLIPNHIDFFLAFLAALIVGYGPFQHLLLSNISHDYMVNYEGGIYPFHFYFFGNFILLILSTWIFRPLFTWVSKLTTNRISGLKKCIAILIVCSTFRWYLYSPFGMIREIIFLSILYTIIKITHMPDRNIAFHGVRKTSRKMK